MAVGTFFGDFVNKIKLQLTKLSKAADNTDIAPDFLELSVDLDTATEKRSESSIALSQSKTIGQTLATTKAYDAMTVVSRQAEIMQLTRDDYFEAAKKELDTISIFYDELSSTVQTIDRALQQDSSDLSDTDDPYLDNNNNIIYPSLD